MREGLQHWGGPVAADSGALPATLNDYAGSHAHAVPCAALRDHRRGDPGEVLAVARWSAAAHAKRDNKRADKAVLAPVTATEYRRAIHQAVIRSGGVDEYTGDDLDWSLIGTYNNAMSKAEGSAYKKRFRRMPSVDHVHGDDHRPHGVDDLRICSWELNDAKADLSWDAFVALCRKVVEFAG